MTNAVRTVDDDVGSGPDAGSPTPPSRSLENQLSFYASSNPTRRALHGARKDWVSAAVRRSAAELVPTRHLAVEIGPGAGLLLPLLTAEFGEVVAVDRNPAFLDAAEALRAEHPNLRVVAADATRLIPGVEPADLVLCSEVLEHVPEPGRFVAGLAGLLAPDGVIVLTTPQRYSTVELAGRLLRQPGVKQVVQRMYGEAVVDLGHISLRTTRQVAEMLAAAGLDVLEHTTLGCYVPGVAELGGERARRFEAWLERKVRGTRLTGMLWTQCWVARRPPS
jgi:2-polyprenyl-3-methyl-5-hydroxy-6-metoxy-1,4-benzoquinol methylase